MSNESTDGARRWPKNTLTTRAVTIAVLALAMLIPIGYVQGVVTERGHSYDTVLAEIAGAWGSPQELLGPVVVVPFTETETTRQKVTDEQGRVRVINRVHRKHRTAKFLPTQLNLDVALTERYRQRSIYRSLVYGARVSLSADFDRLDVATLSDKIEKIHWDKAWVAVGLSDTRAIDSVSELEFDGQKKSLEPGTRLDLLGRGFHAVVPLEPVGMKHSLKLSLDIRGSGFFTFAPFGRTTHVTMKSSWPHPSFMGTALPDERDINADGFTASWNIPHLARNYPQQWVDGVDDQMVTEFQAGVRMFEPITLYSRLNRAVKYGILFIGLTFMTLFGFELVVRQPMHLIQYALIGSALSLFYMVVLSLSEHISFLTAYIVGASIVGLMVSAYTWATLRSGRRALTVLVLLSALYGMLYSVLQQEDFALLTGTIVMLIVIGALMVATRNMHRVTGS